MVKQSCVSTKERSASVMPACAERPPPRFRAALELDDVALRHRQEILRVGRGAEGDGARHAQRRLGVGDHDGRRAVRDERAIGALQRAGDEGVLVALRAAEFEAEILAHLRIRVADAVLVVLGGDHRERVGLVAVALEIEARDLAEDAGEARRRVAVLRQVGGLQEVPADLGPGRRRHLLDADDEHRAGAPRLDRLDRLMHRGRAGGAGILDAGRRLEAEGVARLEHQGGREVLRREAGVEVAEHDLVDVLRPDPGMVERLAAHAHDEALDGLRRPASRRACGPSRRCRRSSDVIPGSEWQICANHAPAAPRRASRIGGAAPRSAHGPGPSACGGEQERHAGDDERHARRSRAGSFPATGTSATRPAPSRPRRARACGHWRRSSARSR